MKGKEFRKNGKPMAYQYYVPAGKLYNKPIGHSGGSQWRSGSMNLIMWGRSTGHTSNGKTLIEMDGVDVGGGDGKIQNGVASFGTALAGVKGWNDTNSFAFWHAPTKRLILKPKDKGARWVQGNGHLFMWADKPLFDDGSPSSTPQGMPPAEIFQQQQQQPATRIPRNGLVLHLDASTLTAPMARPGDEELVASLDYWPCSAGSAGGRTGSGLSAPTVVSSGGRRFVSFDKFRKAGLVGSNVKVKTILIAFKWGGTRGWGGSGPEMVFAQHGKDYSFRWPPCNDKQAYVGCKRDGNDFFGPGSRCDGDVLVNGVPVRSGEVIPTDWHVVHMVKADGREVSIAPTPAARRHLVHC